MAEQTTASQKTTPATNGADRIPWQQTAEGRAKLSAAQKKAHAKRPRSTAPVSAEKKKRLQDLVNGGASVKEAAQLVGVGYSTAQRHITAKNRANNGNANKPTRASSRLQPEQVRMLARLVPKMGPTLRAEEIAKRAKCHISSVYTYRKSLLSEATLPPVHASPAPGSALSASDYADLKEVYKQIWTECWAKQVEPTNAEMSFTRVWRRIR